MKRERKVNAFTRVFDKLEKVELALAGTSLVILFVIVMIGIISRLAGINTPWTEEATRVFFLWMMWIGVGAGFNHAESSRVTVFVNSMPKFIQKICHALYYVLCLALFGIMFVYGIRLAIQQFNMGEMGSALRIPMWLLGICVPTGSFIGILGVINTLISEPYLLETTAEQLEADEYAAKAKEQFDFSEEGGNK